ncbi:hypothetical protein BKI52_15415 [marine bacterium AO1-C]|nr:hypothetical protein BKI52_15415 [marine bacterium AO1-C]
MLSFTQKGNDQEINPSAQSQEAVQKKDNAGSKQGQKPAIQAKQQTIQAKQRPIQAKQKPVQAKQSPVQRNTKSKGGNENTSEAQIKANVSALMGTDVSDAKVHYNSNKPAQLKAEATAQGKEVHLAPGKEQHLGHELTHVAQQQQGRVEPTVQANNGAVNINDDPKLEKEADDIGAKAQSNEPIQAKGFISNSQGNSNSGQTPIQAAGWKRGADTWELIDNLGQKEVGPSPDAMLDSTTEGQVYDDVSETIYKDQEDYQFFKVALFGLSENKRAGKLIISEQDYNQQSHEGFANAMVRAIAALITKPLGQQLVKQLINAPKTTRIVPGKDPLTGPEWQARDEESGPSGTRWGIANLLTTDKADTVVFMPPNYTDSDFTMYGTNFQEIASPEYITLGHELIHAYHLTNGTGYGGHVESSLHQEYDNKEEQETIQTGDITENLLREEQGLAQRFGHDSVAGHLEVLPKQHSNLAHLEALVQASNVNKATLLGQNPSIVTDKIIGDQSDALARHLASQNLNTLRDIANEQDWQQIFNRDPQVLGAVLDALDIAHTGSLTSQNNTNPLGNFITNQPGFEDFMKDVSTNHQNVNIDDMMTLGHQQILTQYPFLKGKLFEHNVSSGLSSDNVEQGIADLMTNQGGAPIGNILLSRKPQFVVETLLKKNLLPVPLIAPLMGNFSLSQVPLPKKMKMPGYYMRRITTQEATLEKEQALTQIAVSCNNMPLQTLKTLNNKIGDLVAGQWLIAQKS